MPLRRTSYEDSATLQDGRASIMTRPFARGSPAVATRTTNDLATRTKCRNRCEVPRDSGRAANSPTARLVRRRPHRLPALSLIIRGSNSGPERPRSRTRRPRLCRWDQFRLGWVEAYSPAVTIEPGDPVAVIARMAGLWWLNACRVIYVIDDAAPIARFGFAYGTLPDHAACGEERFVVEWNPVDDLVWYDILAFSRPRRFLMRIGYRFMRRTQKRFAKESAAAMMLAARSSGSESGR